MRLCQEPVKLVTSLHWVRINTASPCHQVVLVLFWGSKYLTGGNQLLEVLTDMRRSLGGEGTEQKGKRTHGYGQQCGGCGGRRWEGV